MRTPVTARLRLIALTTTRTTNQPTTNTAETTSTAKTTDSDIPDGYIAAGRIVGAWGVRGEIRVEPMGPDHILGAKRAVTVSGLQHTIERSRRSGQHLIMKLAGIDSREDAHQLRGATMQMLESGLPQLPDGEYYRFQLLGLAVVSTAGRELGSIEDIFSTVSNDVYVVRSPSGEILVPAVDSVVCSIDVPAGVVTVEIVPGLMPESKDRNLKDSAGGGGL